jgi:AmmeMemoRadiSam system protein B
MVSIQSQTTADTVEAYIQNSKIPPVEGQVIAVIAPHAGHIYSGPVAGHAFAALRGLAPDLVAVISPMHYPYNQPLISTAHEAYSTPLGNIPVDQKNLAELSQRLKNSLGIDIYLAPQDLRHLEIELFWQVCCLPALNCCPSWCGNKGKINAGARLLCQCIETRTVLVASADLSVFSPQEVPAS